MEFVNDTPLPARWTVAFAPDGREVFVVAIKATFGFPGDETRLPLADAQEPLVLADTFTGEPGVSAPLHETDFAHRKLACDVLVIGSAYAPAGKTATEVIVGARVGPMAKQIRVVGERHWRSGALGMGVSQPRPFDRMPISYDNAFGGVDSSGDLPVTYLQNPVGRGFFRNKNASLGTVLPNTEEVRVAVEDPSGNYRPMAFGPIGRNWQPRMAFAGTYDETWSNTRAPWWPGDFDYRYFQAVPPDQQIPFPQGGEDVVLQNLSPGGQVAFSLPRLALPILFVRHRGSDEVVDAPIDTIVLEPDRSLLTLTWRAVVPLQRNAFELAEVVIGEPSIAARRRRASTDKPHYKNLEELARARRGSR